ncbi:MAG: hypothetical protein IT371_30020 [Deltaproteobacteria bacterium]|nr:hypothetical protein [Deltaproteobacteria bacterium]
MDVTDTPRVADRRAVGVRAAEGPPRSPAVRLLRDRSHEVDPQNVYMGRSALDARGPAARQPWFEWWYYKAVVPATGEAIFAAYGVVNPTDVAGRSGASQAFLIFGAPRRKLLLVERLPVRSFEASSSSTYVRVGRSHATACRAVGEVAGQGHRARWDLGFATRWRFPATGWVSWFPAASNIHWHPAQADARVSGVVELDGERLELVGAPGYQDHNWGSSFPRYWLWIACNTFADAPETALVVGGGLPRAMRRVEVGSVVCVGLRHEGRVHAFRSTDLHGTRVEPLPGGWRVEASDGRRRITVEARAPLEAFLPIELDTPDGGRFVNYETLAGDLQVRLEERSRVLRWRKVVELSSRQAGLEIGLDARRAPTSLWQRCLGREPALAPGRALAVAP